MIEDRPDYTNCFCGHKGCKWPSADCAYPECYHGQRRPSRHIEVVRV